VTVEDTTPPAITAPANATIEYKRESPSVDFDATDHSTLDTWEVNDTDFTIDGTGQLTNTTVLPTATHILNITVNDTYGNTAWAGYNVTVTQNTENCDIYFNETSPLEYPNNFIVYTNCTTDYALYRNGTTISNASAQDLAVGTYNFTVSRGDKANYSETEDTEYFTVEDTTPPAITAPANATIEYKQESLSVDFNATDHSTLDTWEVNDTDFTIDGTGQLTNTTVTGVGNYTLNITINDTHGNLNSTIYEVTVEDTTAPTLSWDWAYANSTTTDNSTLVVWIASDASGIDVCNLTVNGTTYINTSGLPTQTQNLTMGNGNWSLSLNCNDTEGNSATAPPAWWYVDADRPNITLISPPDGRSFSASSVDVDFIFEVSDSTGIAYCSVLLDGDEHPNSSAIDESGTNTITVNSILSGTHTWRVYCNDMVGNGANSTPRDLTVARPDEDSGGVVKGYYWDTPEENETKGNETKGPDESNETIDEPEGNESVGLPDEITDTEDQPEEAADYLTRPQEEDSWLVYIPIALLALFLLFFWEFKRKKNQSLARPTS
jgi:hypothetical protein